MFCSPFSQSFFQLGGWDKLFPTKSGGGGGHHTPKKGGKQTDTQPSYSSPHFRGGKKGGAGEDVEDRPRAGAERARKLFVRIVVNIVFVSTDQGEMFVLI